MRGRHDEQAFVTAHLILSQGGVVGMYGEGGRSRSKQLREPKPGLGRLALESGVPVTPIAIHGSQDVREVKRLKFPKVTIQYGEPIKFEQILKPTREQAQRASTIVFDRIREMHEALQSLGRKGVLKALRERQRLGLTRTTPTLVTASDLAEAPTRERRFKQDSPTTVESSHVA
jgi:1-acyl-sn-glycerol-3-phosphate acyltransferase